MQQSQNRARFSESDWRLHFAVQSSEDY